MYTLGLWDDVKYEMFEWGSIWGNPDLRIDPVIINYPPVTPPQPSGISKGEPSMVYEFSTLTTDPENNDIYYWFDWDDGTNSDWLGPYVSGGTCSASHSWINPGVYEVTVKAKDTFDHESTWSVPASVTVYISGDCNGDTLVDTGDVVYLVNYLYKNGPLPIPVTSSGDCNGDSLVDVGDVVYLINYLYKNGPSPSG